MAPVTLPRLLNGPIEIGLRSLVLLVEAFPADLDLQRLVTLDYFLVHSADIPGGPESLHPPSPLRSGEVAVRRGMLEQGLVLYRSRGLVSQRLSEAGIRYRADDTAPTLLDALSAGYVAALRLRADWIFQSVGLLDERELATALNTSLDKWRSEFAVLATEDEPS
jgi:hypothetical protein